jgi:hypothetical protein
LPPPTATIAVALNQLLRLRFKKSGEILPAAAKVPTEGSAGRFSVARRSARYNARVEQLLLGVVVVGQAPARMNLNAGRTRFRALRNPLVVLGYRNHRAL